MSRENNCLSDYILKTNYYENVQFIIHAARNKLLMYINVNKLSLLNNIKSNIYFFKPVKYTMINDLKHAK